MLAGINHKMGFRGTVNTAPVFGDGAFTPGGRPGAVGYLVGAEHRGLPHVHDDERGPDRRRARRHRPRLHRLPQVAGLRTGAAAGPPVGASPETPQVPLVEHPDVRRMLLAQKSYVEGALALVLYCSRLFDDIASLDDADREGRGGAAARGAHPDRQELAVAVVPGRQRPRHPGARRRRLHPRPRRRAALPRQPAQPDPRGHPRHPGAGPARSQGADGRRRRAGRCSSAGCTPPRAGPPTPRPRGVRVRRAARVRCRPARRGHRCHRGPRRPRSMLADATAYLEATGHLVVAWLWLEQWLVADGKEAAFYEGKRAATRYFFTRELPKVGRCSTCWPRATAPRWTSTPASSDGPRDRPQLGMSRPPGLGSNGGPRRRRTSWARSSHPSPRRSTAT